MRCIKQSKPLILSNTHAQSTWNCVPIVCHCLFNIELAEVNSFKRLFGSLWIFFSAVWFSINTWLLLLLEGKPAEKRYHLRCLPFNIVWKEVTMSCVQHVTYFLNAFNFMVKSFYVIFSLFLIGFVRNPQIIHNNSPWYLASKRSNNSLVVY